MEALIIGLVYIVAVIFSIVLHEVAHGAMANSLGDSTAKDLGRLTLNPFKHLDLFGSVILPLLTYYSGGFIFGYAKPVPYNPLNLSDRRTGPVKVALAGPATNIVVAVLVGLALRFFPGSLVNSVAGDLLKFVVQINLLLAIFNLIPIPPLDGHWVLLALLPNRFQRFRYFLQQGSWLFLIIVILFVSPFLRFVIDPLFRLIVG